MGGDSVQSGRSVTVCHRNLLPHSTWRRTEHSANLRLYQTTRCHFMADSLKRTQTQPYSSRALHNESRGLGMHMDNILFQFCWCVLSGPSAGACELTLRQYQAQR